MKKIFIFLFLLNFLPIVSQETESRGKIVVPITFTFANGENPYNISSHTKAFFEKKRFQVFFDNNILPDEIAQNRCNALFVDIQKLPGVLVTKISVSIKDCKGNMLIVSEEGRSRQKELRLAYVDALREALNTLEVSKIVKESQVRTTQTLEVKPIDNQEAVNLITTGKDVVVTESSKVFYAQPITNGFQLVDSTPKVALKILKTSHPDYYIAVSDTVNGVLFKRNNQWIYEYYQDNKLVTEILQVKF